ncbi:MAG: GNAT family N-acetyltransferase [Gemmatimonadota bacterium]
MNRVEPAIELGDWERLRAEVLPIRFAVFVGEQKVPADLEVDEWDARSLHAVARDPQQRAIGTARLLPDGHIGRVAVLREARGAGVGAALIRSMLQAARERGHVEVVLSAQMHALDFYRRLGFREEGVPYDDAGIPHLTMRLRL